MVVLDHRTALLNPCSLETTAEPIEVDKGNVIWPLIVACYELQPDGVSRRGMLDLYSVSMLVPGQEDHATSLGATVSGEHEIKFGDPYNVMGENDESSGILDGKWLTPIARGAADGLVGWFATAHSSGEIIVHAIEKSSEHDDMDSKDAEKRHPFKSGMIGSIQVAFLDDEETALCLSLCWDATNVSLNHDETKTRIISTYSNGCISIHNASIKQEKIKLEELCAWKGHMMFHSPAEVWSACFVPGDINTVLSGGDEGSLKVWDLRMLLANESTGAVTRPAQTLRHFEAGVTVLSPHPRRPHLVACGSYDETVALYDVRYMTSPLFHSDALGGGIWRAKWHPRDDNRLLLGAMHGGCRVIRVDNWEESVLQAENDATVSLTLTVEQEFTCHKSMTYGADWLAYKPLRRAKYFDIAASCSFYDRALYLWTVPQESASQGSKTDRTK